MLGDGKILLAGSMVLAHATGFEDPSDCGPSGSPSVQPSGYGFADDPNSVIGDRYFGYLIYAGGY